MEFIYGKADFCSMERGQENCYLQTNGLGGYSSLTMIGSCARNDHALLMAGVTAPTKRYHMISRMQERICIGEMQYELSAQEYVDYTRNEAGYVYLNSFSKDIFPVWEYQVRGVCVTKSLVMKHGENTIGIRYRVENGMQTPAELVVTPWMQFVPKGKRMREDQTFVTTKEWISGGDLTLYYQTNGQVQIFTDDGDKEACGRRAAEAGEASSCVRVQGDYYYAMDARDGRPAVGNAAATHEIVFAVPPLSNTEFYVIYSMERNEYAIDTLFKEEKKRQQMLSEAAGIQDPVGEQLVRSGDCFFAKRESTGEKTIIAGYPFFGDWGRDTMIAVSGLGIAAGRYDETKSIFRSFLRYCRRGLMPNMFPESGQEPMYNTVDASLLFICAVYEYYERTGDREFLAEAWQQMQDIISWYKKGTDFHIRMDEDGLLLAGAALEQVTWMDIRYGDILPTPRHGKPVEINVWWYNALKSMEVFAGVLCADGESYGRLAKRVKKSFGEKFFHEEAGCLYDTVSGEAYDRQIRCNQIWAVSAAFSVLDEEKERLVTETVFEHLYTPYGLRTLSPEDPEFKPVYGGSLYARDMAYHQGTVWPFPLGAYYLAYLKVNRYSAEAKECVRRQLRPLSACLREGCIGQIAEVYDGLIPGCSKGCFAQAWSVGELLKVYAALERT